MRRVLVLGRPCSGKSTFSRHLAKRTGLPLISLDAHYWKPGWVSTPREAWRVAVHELCSAERWIQDGNYDSSLDIRLPHADTVVIFDMPLWLCFSRVAWRVAGSYGKTRPEMAPGCPERIDLSFISYIWNFDRRNRLNVERKLATHGHHLVPVIFRRDADARRFIDSLPVQGDL